MTVLEILDMIFIGPLKLCFEIIFSIANRMIGHPGLAIIVLSLVMNVLVLPLYKRADAMQEEARDIDAKLSKGVAHIKKTFSGDERMMILQTYYRQNNYRPTDALNGSVSLLLEIPFFMAAYQFLSNLEILNGVSLGPIQNLGAPDGLLVIGGITLGGLSKGEIRQIALEQGLVNARKRESQDICFIPDGDYASFIRRHTGKEYPCGAFISENGQVLGQHSGIIGYTVGQRRGLGVSSNQGRLYVKELRVADNTVVLCDNQSLFSRSLTASQLNWIAVAKLDTPMRLKAKVRYRQQEQPCVVEQTGEDTVRVIFDQPQRAITPGQMVVFYDGDVVVGGGVIAEGKG